MLWLLGVLVTAGTLLLTTATPAPAQSTNQCAPGQVPRYTAGFADLKAYIGAPMGNPVTCEYPDPNGTGDVHQRTTTGLAFWRKATNTPTFTNGFEHWGRTPAGWVTWTGSSIDPPATAAPAVPPPEPPTGVVPTPGNPVCISAEIDGPAMMCWFADGYFRAIRRTASADVVLASQAPGSVWFFTRPASGVSCGRVDDPPPEPFSVACNLLEFEYFKWNLAH